MFALHLNRYLWQIYRQLPGSWKQKKRILSRVANSIRDYVSEGSGVTYDQLVKRFGRPEQIVSDYVADMETEELITVIHSRQRIVRIVLIAAIVLIMLWAGLVVASYHSFEKDMNGYAVVGVIEITDSNIESE